MIKKRILSLLSAAALLCGMGQALAADSPGSAQDPLISKSYIDTTFRAAVLNGPLQNLADSVKVLEFKLSQAGRSKGGLAFATLMPQATASLPTGAGFSIISGYARLSSASGTVLDLTEGISVSPGQALKSGHRYLAAENTTAKTTAVTGMRLALYGSVSIQSSGALTFKDVPDNSWFFPHVAYAAHNKLVDGRTALAYEPDANLSIAEAIKLAACIHQIYYQGSVSLKNGSNLWYQTYVDYAAENGIISKTYPNYNAVITRSEFISIFHAALPASEFPQINTVGDNRIPDVKLSDANASQIYAFYRAGVVNGSDGAGSFFPASNIRRSEVATLVTRMFEKDARVSISL